MNNYKDLKVEAEAVAEAICKLSEEEKLKLYYMAKGAELVSDKKPPQAS